ncbi:hypothetical protein J7337_010770 [Fusarium musae]|uniref:AB hydrolase-1 domain-containing protein n=1 Tax=Fusarium musae TaxID=1042133 RepID=A0A9P8D9P1_9HYPO|nr:hypothetical protein J7337_010770 [Fusarium musae]KAG9497898.1 hypothetical protein J7337_010770 [Fusarium musae]
MTAVVAAARPALVIVPGNFSLPRFWSAIQRLVEDKGYAVEVIPLQSSREVRIDPAPGLADDVKEAQSLLNKHINQGKDVIMLMHSYGGMVRTEATRGLGRIKREKAGLKATIFTPPGKNTRGLYQTNPGRYPRRKGEGLPPAQGIFKISQASRVFGDEQTYNGFHGLIPSSYTLTKKDVTVPEAA